MPCTSSMFFLNHDVMVTSGGDRSVIEGKLWRIGCNMTALVALAKAEVFAACESVDRSLD